MAQVIMGLAGLRRVGCIFDVSPAMSRVIPCQVPLRCASVLHVLQPLQLLPAVVVVALPLAVQRRQVQVFLHKSPQPSPPCHLATVDY
jgi:hypothetical protein